jgi:large subunit ribosomal protein L21
VGNPAVEGAVVTASVVGRVRGPKIRVFKMKRRKGYRRTNGHRQHLLRVRIDGIEA